MVQGDAVAQKSNRRRRLTCYELTAGVFFLLLVLGILYVIALGLVSP